MQKYDIQLSNVKGILIFLVVFGHLYLALTHVASPFTVLIYAFHMPAFIFLNGYFSQRVTLKKVGQLGVTYVFVQIFFYGFAQMTDYAWLPTQWLLLTPVFHLWYFISLASWYLFWLVWRRFRSLSAVWFVLFLSLAIFIRYVPLPLDHNLLAYLRTFVFFPFFLLGAFFSEKGLEAMRNKVAPYTKPILLLGLVFLGALYGVIRVQPARFLALFYGNLPAQAFSGQLWTFLLYELFQYVSASLLLGWLLVVAPKRVLFLTRWGLSTWPIFLWHPIGYFLIYQWIPMQKASVGTFLLTGLLSFGICMGLSRLKIDKWLKMT